MKKEQSIETVRHSCAHLMAAAIQKIWPDAKFGVGPTVENGFYYDVEIPNHSLSVEDLPKIEKQMKKLISANLEFEKKEIGIDEAIKLFQEKKQDYKVDLLNNLKSKGTTAIEGEEKPLSDKDPVLIYQTGDFIDLCRGPHIDSTKDIKVFKLTKVAGAYWRGNENNPMLTRIYGVCFENKEELKKYEEMLAEAEKRDHRKIGKEMEIFYIDEMVGKGLPIWLPNGTIMKDEIEKMAVEMENDYDYQRVTTPHLAKKELYETSGHLPYYEDDMYPPMEMDDGTYYLRAMNCPQHHLIFKAKPRSYREMPIRLAEYGTVYRNELSGTLAGLLRVRMLSMNDAHIYCRQDQIKDEFKKVIELNLKYFEIFGLKDYWFRLSKWSPKHTDKYINEPKNWDFSQKVIKEVLDELKVDYIEADDEAAFYGPKLDVQFKSVIGREETMSTIQLDFAAKSRFNLVYTDNKGNENNSVFVIHRAPLSTHERFLAFLIEHFVGNFPVWLSPVQISILPVGADHKDYCQKLADKFKSNDLRVTVDDANETIGNKIRKATGQKVPYILVIGDKEINSDNLHVRLRGSNEVIEMSEQDFIDRIKQEISNRKDN